MVTNGQIISANLGFLLTGTQSAAAQSKKTENASSFEDFLSSSSSKAINTDKSTPVRTSSVQKHEKTSDNHAENNTDGNVKQKTFREYEKDIKVENKKAVLQGKKATVKDAVDSEDGESKTEISNSQKADIMLNCLAQVMGVSVGELAKLLESAGIKPEELASASESGTLDTKLIQALGLDEETGNTLVEILKLIDTQVEEAVSTAFQDQQGEKSQGPKLNAAEIKVVLPENKSADAAGSDIAVSEMSELSSLMQKLKLKLKELGEKLEQNETALIEEIKIDIRPVLKDASAMLKASVKPVESVELPDENADIEAGMDIEASAAKESDNEKAGNGAKQTADTETLIPQQASTAPEAQDTAQVFGNMVNQPAGKEAEIKIENLIAKAPVTGREILAQVIEKAKVVLTADKSEMVMDLKPDSLGKLSLKVVTEQGIVMAQFVAESQQVKQVLETNMQLLKDSLEKQGLNVQGFSVSVRQESQNNSSSYNSNENNGRRAAATVQMPGSGIYADAEDVERLQRINPYRQEGNTINLTA